MNSNIVIKKKKKLLDKGYKVLERERGEEKKNGRNKESRLRVEIV